MVFILEVFNAATGYLEGDDIRFIFKDVKVTVDGNDHEIFGAEGQEFDSRITEAMRGTNSASTLTPAQINNEVVDVLNVDTFALPGQVAPPSTPTLREALLHLYKYLRNKREQTATVIKVYDDAGAVVDHKATISDDTTTATKEKFGSGP